ncbi:MAG: hypothetical protein A2X23_13720 [Chloroflexi bacterium GWC2_73_18]|nr:MAG: hypothetical protein A2X23_13720 [Chloroflexi bacterium GWC2_73_18]
MRKTSVYLSDDEAESLRRVAAAAGRAQAELIREGIRRVIAEAEAQPRTFRSLGKGRGGGRAYSPWAPGDLYRNAIGER